MDTSKITRSMWIVIGGTVATLIGTLFLPWYSVLIFDFSAWDSGTIGKLAVLGMLLMVAGVALMFIPNPPELPVPLPMAMLFVSAFTALMVVLKFIDIHQDTGIGLWLSLIGALVAAYGAYEMGGRFSMSSGSV
jgi:hypothetical protein